MRKVQDQTLIDPLEPFLGYQLRRVSADAMAQLAARLTDDGVSPALATVLLMIEANPGETQARIGRELSIKRANIAPMIAKLEDEDLVRREYADGRSFRLYCTSTGRSVIARVKRIMKQHEETVFSGLSDTQKTQLLTTLKQLRRQTAPDD